MSFNPLSFVLAGFVTVLLTLGPAQAFTGKDKIPPLKSEVELSPEEFKQGTDLIEETPQGNEALAYQIRLPKGWLKSDLAIANLGEKGGTEIFQQISSYTSPPRLEEGSMFRMKVIDLDSLTRVDDWFISYMLQMGFSVEGMSLRSPNEVVSQYTVFEEGEPYVTRTVVTLTGSRIVVAEYLVHQDVYASERDQQILAMSSFKLVNQDTGIGIPMKTFSFVDIAKFDYPSNWTLATPGISNIMRMDASVVNTVQLNYSSGNGVDIEMQKLAARIDVSVVSKTPEVTLAGEIKKLNEELQEKNFKLGSFIETGTDVKVSPLIGTARVDVYNLEGTSKRLAGYEYWVAVLQTKSRYYFVRMVTISRGEAFQSWAQNTETYRALIASLGPAPGRFSN